MSGCIEVIHKIKSRKDSDYRNAGFWVIDLKIIKQ